MSVELLLTIFGAVASIVYGFWLIASWAVAQFEKRLDERFEAQEKARKEGRELLDTKFKDLEGKYDRLQLSVNGLLIELPREYVRREDWVRSQSLIEAKLDALALRMENLFLRGGRDA